MRGEREFGDHACAEDEGKDDERGEPSVELCEDRKRNGCNQPDANEDGAYWILFG